MDTRSQSADAVAAEHYPLRWVVATVVLAANMVDLLDATIVNVAAPSIQRDLGGGGNTIQWLSAGYTLAFAVLLIAGARLGDIFGRRRLFLIGSAGFTLFSAACSVAPNIDVLIAFRAMQGVAVLGTIFFSAFGHHLPSYALEVTAWACLVPLAIAFTLVFLLPMHAREEGS